MREVIFNIFKHKIYIRTIINSRLHCPVKWVNRFNANANLKQRVVSINMSFIPPPKNILLCATDFTLVTFL